MHTRGVIASPKYGRSLAFGSQPGGATAAIPVQLALGLRSLVLMEGDAEMQRRFAYALRAAMVQKGWKAPDLAKAIKRDASTVDRWVNEKSLPNILVTKQLAGALGVKPEFLFDPPPVPAYPLAEYLVDQAVASGVEEGRRRAQAHEDREPLAPSPGRRPRAAGAGRGR